MLGIRRTPVLKSIVLAASKIVSQIRNTNFRDNNIANLLSIN